MKGNSLKHDLRWLEKEANKKIQALEKEKEFVELAKEVIKERLRRGMDRFPYQINDVVARAKELYGLDLPSRYSVLVNEKQL